MRTHSIATVSLFIGAALLFGIATFAGAATQNLPNLTPFPAKDIRIGIGTDGNRALRFSTVSWNKGLGPLELRAGTVDNLNGRQEVLQRIYLSDGTFQDVSAGSFVWHSGHNHFHFDDYALYTLQLASAPGASDRIGAKTTFCVMDTTRVDIRWPNASKKAVYKTCGATIQGMSVGWGDQYGYQLIGQEIDITGLPDGDYNLKIEVDPKGHLEELDTSDNVSNVHLRLTGNTVTVLP
jgi:hypothetical protein